MSDLKRWQRLAIERVITADLAELELDEARGRGDPEAVTIADRYHHQAQRLLATANRKLAELSA